MNSPVHISVVEMPAGTELGADYVPSAKTIHWSPYNAVKTTNGVVISPATVLDHEADHTQQHLKHPEQFKKDTDPKTGKDKSYGDKEEKRVITGREQKTARKLKEIKPGQVTRKDHKGENIRVSGPTSTTPAAEEEAERLLREKKKAGQ